MNLLVWNYRGLGNLRTKKELGNIIRAKDPSIVFLAETWADEARLDRVLHNINFDNKWEVCRGRKGGGLVLFWKNDVHVTIEDSHRYFIDVTLDKVGKQNGDLLGSMESLKLIEEWRFRINWGV